MGTPFITSTWIRHLSKTTTLCRRELSSQATRPIALTPSSSKLVSIDTFRENAFKPQKPFFFGRNAGSPTTSLPAASKWFEKHTASSNVPSTKFSPYMGQFQEWGFPYELVTPSVPNKDALQSFHSWLSSSQEPVDKLLANILEPSIQELESGSFFQILAPLRLLIKALEFNQTQSEPVSLYIAQSSLTDLPKSLQNDLPTPDVVRGAGKGDVYASSIWLGTEPTYTPLHRDPNPNAFCQLCSDKVIRLMAPALGDRLYFQVQSRIRQQGNSRIRTVEMMEGKEREALYEAVWEHDPLPEGLYEAELGPGDALFIPNGWWHSVKSKGSKGYLNGSVNWWFR